MVYHRGQRHYNFGRLACGRLHNLLQALDLAVEGMADIHRPQTHWHNVYYSGRLNAVSRGFGRCYDMAAAVALGRRLAGLFNARALPANF